MPKFDTALAWFPRDLRDFDHAAPYHALKQSRRVFCVFIFDPVIQSEKFDPDAHSSAAICRARWNAMQ